MCHNVVAAGRFGTPDASSEGSTHGAASTATGCECSVHVCMCCDSFGCTGGEQDRQDEWGSHGGTVSQAKVSLDTDSQCDSTRF